MTATATYVYAITRPIEAAKLGDLSGVGGAAVRVLEHGAIAGVVSTVDLCEFGEDALADHLEDMAWLARTAREHDEVVRAASRITTTVPLRMATICHDDASVHVMLDTLDDATAKVLAELDGRDEWGVKLFALADAGDAPAVVEQASSGTAYLQQRRRALQRDEQAAQAAAHDADAVFAALADAAVASRLHRPQDQRLSGNPHPMVLNAAFLVDRRDEQAFRAVVATLADERPAGALVLTGPWPPYSFVPEQQ